MRINMPLGEVFGILVLHKHVHVLISRLWSVCEAMFKATAFARRVQKSRLETAPEYSHCRQSLAWVGAAGGDWYYSRTFDWRQSGFHPYLTGDFAGKHSGHNL